MKKNVKGFTLVEVLAAVVVLGIISTAASVAIGYVIDSGHEKHYATVEEQLKSAGESFAEHNRGYLPKYIGQKTKIFLNTLIDNNYISKLKDYNGQECYSNVSYVEVFKYSQSDYRYTAYLMCPNHTTKNIQKGAKPVITKQSLLRYEIEDNDKLLSYSYKVFYNDKEIKNTGSIYLDTHPKKIEVTIDYPSSYISGVTMIISAVDIYGNMEVIEYLI